MSAFFIKQGDTSPAILRQLLDAAGNPIDLTGAAVAFNMASTDGTLVCNAKAASVFTGTLPDELGGGTVTAADGWMRYVWVSADTAISGQHIAEFQVTYPDASIETVPNSTYINVNITPDISAANYPYTPPAVVPPETLLGAASFATRALFVTWAAAQVGIETGMVVSAAGFSYRYIGTGTAISDLPGWVPNGDAQPGHWGAAGDGATNDATALAAWAAYTGNAFHLTASTINHPDTRDPLTVAISGAGSTVYKLSQSHVSLRGKLKGTSATGFTLLVEPGAAGITGARLSDMDIESAGFSVLFKDISALNGMMRNVGVMGLNIHGGADTADVGVSFDGNTENAVVIGNTISDIQRNDSAPRKAHAFAVAGLAGGGGPTADSANLSFIGNAVYDVAGNVFHIEDLSPGVVTVGNVGKTIDRGLEIVNDAVPQIQAHIGNAFTGWTSNAIYNAGTGSSRMIAYAFNMMDGTGSTAATAHVRINQKDTRDQVYLGNMHYNLTGDALESTAEGRVYIDLNTFDTVTGDAIVGKASITDGRGLMVTSRNSFRSVGGILDKTNSANVMGDQIAGPALMISNISADEVLFQAKRPGFLTKVTLIHDDTPLSGVTNATFAVLKRTAGGVETTLFDNDIKHAGTAWEVVEWTAENAQITTHTWAAGDLILVRCIPGGATNNRSAEVQIEFFEYN